MITEFSVKVYRYENTLANAFAYQVENWTGRANGLVFQTKNPGGFSECSFQVNMSFARSLEVYGSYHHYFVLIESGGGGVAWQGRIEDITVAPGQVSITCQGFWGNAFDAFYDDGSLRQTPIADNSILNLTGYASLSGTNQMFAQSFIPSSDNAIQDIQIRLSNFGVTQGNIHFELRQATKDGSLLAESYIAATTILGTGFSEYVALTTEVRLDSSTTYWIVVYGDGDYWGNQVDLTGSDDSGVNNKAYMQDSDECWLSRGIAEGTQVRNTTQAYTVTVSGSQLSSIATPNRAAYFYDATGPTWNNMTEVVDDNAGTYYTVSNFNYAEDYLYFGNSTEFGGISFDIYDSDVQNLPAEMIVEYGDGGSWVRIYGVEDNTSDASRPFAQDGTVRWAIPDSWGDTTVQGNAGKWVRISFTSIMDTSFGITEVDVGLNSRLNFSDMGGDDWDNGDGWSTEIGIAIGIDTGENYADGLLQKYYNGSWSNYSADAIFYVWGHPKWFYSTGDISTVADVIEDIISECTFINDSTGFFYDVGRTANPIRFTSQEKHGKAIERMVAFGSSDAEAVPLTFCVWEDGYAHLQKQTDGMVWNVDFKNIPIGQQAMSITSSLKGYKTHTAVLYSDSVGVRSITEWAGDDDIYDMFGYTREGLYSIAGADQGVAEIIADMIRDVYSMPAQKLDILIDGYVTDNAGKRWPAWMVRAGDIVKLRNMLPSSAVFSSELEERLTTLYIQETSYNAETGRLRITPTEFTQSLLDIILSLAGLSGGSML